MLLEICLSIHLEKHLTSEQKGALLTELVYKSISTVTKHWADCVKLHHQTHLHLWNRATRANKELWLVDLASIKCKTLIFFSALLHPMLLQESHIPPLGCWRLWALDPWHSVECLATPKQFSKHSCELHLCMVYEEYWDLWLFKLYKDPQGRLKYKKMISIIFLKAFIFIFLRCLDLLYI